MPKTNDNTGATAAGETGIVEHGAPLNDGRTLSELDPERNLDGTLIEGEHPDHADGEEREVSGTTEVTTLEPAGDDENDETPESAPEREEEPSPGYNSPASSKKIASTHARNSKTSR